MKIPNKKKCDQDFFTALIWAELHLHCVKEHMFHPTRKWRFDYCIEEKRIAIECEGGVFTNGRHTRGAGFMGDMEKYNAATCMGWRILRVTPTSLNSVPTIEMIEKLSKI